ncbi:ABC transporter ATP-binding protein [Angustibacter sp. McL0619]|uniref:ABC transporter ATP-binding protein n=1 Tax=Angustibacter sp. McL0619 TaxID=3415676 RepID=UPI003CF7632D
MSEGIKTAEEKAAEARRGPRTQRGPGMGMAMPTEKSQDFVPSAKRLLRLLEPQRVQLTAVLALALGAVSLSALGPRILGGATDIIFAGAIGAKLDDDVTQAQVVEGLRARGENQLADLISGIKNLVPGQGIDFAALGRVLVFVMMLYVVASLLQWAQGWILTGAVNRTIYKLRSDVEDKLGRLPLPYFDNQPRGELLSRVTNDIDNLAQGLQQTLSQLLTSLLTVVAMIAMMLWISPLLAVLALVTIPVTMVVTAIIGKRAQKHFVQQWKSTGQLNAIIEESFTGHSLVKVFGRQHENEQVFAEKNQELHDAGFGAQFISGIIMPTMMFIGNLNYVVIAVVGGLQVANGSMTLGSVQAFIQYSRQFTQPLTQVASMSNLMQSAVASAERVFELLDAEEQEPDHADAQVLDDPHGRVAFESVSFSYSKNEPLIEDLSLSVDPGQTVAIVGPTGAGKTTLVNLIMRFYELDSGRITLDGVDITDLTRNALRSEIGMVLQDTWLFAGTIRENIAYGRPSASDEEVMAAARATFVDRFVHSLPDGYETVLDAEASNISAGEKQLVTIARAFLADPALLILDEATSSVDTRTELLVQQAMAALRTDRTSFVIAHRLSTIRDADVILVMEHGAIVEQGDHAELLARGGVYANLYAAQFSGAAIEAEDAGSNGGSNGGAQSDLVPAGAPSLPEAADDAGPPASGPPAP